MPVVQDYDLKNIHPVPQPSNGPTSTSKNFLDNCADGMHVRTEPILPRLAGLKTANTMLAIYTSNIVLYVLQAAQAKRGCFLMENQLKTYT